MRGAKWTLHVKGLVDTRQLTFNKRAKAVELEHLLSIVVHHHEDIDFLRSSLKPHSPSHKLVHIHMVALVFVNQHEDTHRIRWVDLEAVEVGSHPGDLQLPLELLNSDEALLLGICSSENRL